MIRNPVIPSAARDPARSVRKTGMIRNPVIPSAQSCHPERAILSSRAQRGILLGSVRKTGKIPRSARDDRVCQVGMTGYVKSG